MRRPHMSTGAWIFASVIAASVIAPTAVYAAATSTVAIGNTGNSNTATVTTQHQLLTATVAAKDVVHASGISAGSACDSVYTPPAGKAIVVTSVTYDLWGNTSGADHLGQLRDGACNVLYDVAETDEVDMSESHTFPIGLPMPSVAVSETPNGNALVFITGYLIPASQLPAASPAHDQGAVPQRTTRP